VSFIYQKAFITIAAVDLKTVVNFYQQLFDRQPDVYLDNIYAEFHLNDLCLGIFKPKDRPEFANSAGSGMSICLEVENLETAIAHLTEIGCSIPDKITTASHGKEIYIYDPVGNRLILHESF
jgi:predicted enzyme related to lactoylglutathione lyase